MTIILIKIRNKSVFKINNPALYDYARINQLNQSVIVKSLKTYNLQIYIAKYEINDCFENFPR